MTDISNKTTYRSKFCKDHDDTELNKKFQRIEDLNSDFIFELRVSCRTILELEKWIKRKEGAYIIKGGYLAPVTNIYHREGEWFLSTEISTYKLVL